MAQPPDKLYNAWCKERSHYYEVLEPNAPPRDAAPYVPRGGCRQVTLVGAESELIWTTILAGNYPDVIKIWDEVTRRRF